MKFVDRIDETACLKETLSREKSSLIVLYVMAESIDKKCLLVGECKWTTQKNGKQLAAELLRKARLLPFAMNYTIVPVLFLKSAPQEDVRNALLPEDIMELAG